MAQIDHALLASHVQKLKEAFEAKGVILMMQDKDDALMSSIHCEDEAHEKVMAGHLLQLAVVALVEAFGSNEAAERITEILDALPSTVEIIRHE